MTCVETVTELLDRIRRGNGAGVQALVASSVEWETPGSEDGPAVLGYEEIPGFVRALRQMNDEREARDIVEIAGSVVVRTEGTIQPPSGIKYGGTGWEVYDCDNGGLVERRRYFAYRKNVLDALGQSREAREGLLVVTSDDDERLYHFGIEPRSEMRWSQYEGQDHAHCEMCWQTFMATEHPGISTEGYATLDGRLWLCADCFDEGKDHFRLREIGR